MSCPIIYGLVIPKDTYHPHLHKELLTKEVQHLTQCIKIGHIFTEHVDNKYNIYQKRKEIVE